MIAATTAWAPPPPAPTLRDDDVHVWLVDLERVRPHRAALVATLSSDERARAARFCFDRDRFQFEASRAVLRSVLGSYLDRDPRALAFSAGPGGKPLLADPGGQVAFNLSHSAGLTLIAASRRGEVGIDVEAYRPLDDRDDLAERFFSIREAARLRSLPEQQRTAAFFACWSRKEAYVKAVGDGLAYPLDAFDVTFAPGDPVRLTIPGDRAESGRWTLEAIEVPEGYAAALVTEGRRPVEHWIWDSRRTS